MISCCKTVQIAALVLFVKIDQEKVDASWQKIVNVHKMFIVVFRGDHSNLTLETIS